MRTSVSILIRSGQLGTQKSFKSNTNNNLKCQGMEVVRSSGLKIRALILFPGSPLLNTKISGRSSALSIPFASVKCSICKRGAQLLIAGSHVNSLPFKFKWDAGLYSLMFKNSNLCFQCMNIWSFPSEAHPPFTG